MITKEQVEEALERVLDPDIGVDIVTMGLIYGVEIQDAATIRIVMTLTSPLCPQGAFLQEQVRATVAALGFTNVTVDITFEPAWTPSLLLKEMLGMSTAS